MLIFFPIRAQIKLHKWPVLTILISIVCLAIYYAQARNENRIVKSAGDYCVYQASSSEREAWGQLGRRAPTEICSDTLAYIHTSPRPELLFQDMQTWLNRQLNSPAEAARTATELRTSYYRFATGAPSYLTGRLWMERPSWNVLRMLSSAFAHGSWDHVVFNLIFFFAFGATIELLLGPVLFLAVVLLLSLGIGVVDTLAHLGQEVTVSLGLSGVVTGMLALFIYFVPRAKIRFFFWFLLSVGFVGVPGWFVGMWYIGGDLLRHLGGAQSHTNYIAHLSGAAIGFLLGMTLFRGKRHWAQELVEDKEDLTQDQGFFRKLNFYTATPGVVGLSVAGFIVAIVLIARFVTAFWLQLLLAAPALAAFWQIYRMRRAQRPDRDRFEEASARLARGEVQAAVRELEPLAARGHARAMLTLGSLYESGRGVLKDLAKAVHWYEQAAKRNNPEAQYRVGLMHAEGRGLRKDRAQMLDWWQRAARTGHAQAAMSLGHATENTAGTREERELAREEAAKWYYQAGKLFLKTRQIEDARMAMLAIRGLKADHPLAKQLEAEVAGTVAPAGIAKS